MSTIAPGTVAHGSRWPAHRDRVTLAELLHAQALTQRVRGECGRCGATMDGTFAEEIEWFKTHECKAVAA